MTHQPKHDSLSGNIKIVLFPITATKYKEKKNSSEVSAPVFVECREENGQINSYKPGVLFMGKQHSPRCDAAVLVPVFVECREENSQINSFMPAVPFMGHRQTEQSLM